MKSPTARAFVVAAILFAIVFSLWCSWWVAFGPMVAQIKNTREMLLNKVDHASVLAACHELIDTMSGQALWVDDPRVPEAIADLQPNYLVIESDHVRIEFGGGFHYQGLLAFAENADTKPYKTGTQELIDGLWFHEDTE